MSEPETTTTDAASPITHNEPLWTLRWTCPRCGRTRLAAEHVTDSARMNTRLSLSSEESLDCHRCSGHWQVWECGIDWQPENEAARHALRDHRGS